MKSKTTLWAFLLYTLTITGFAVAGEGRSYRIPFHFANGLILLDAEVNGKPSTLVLDTGARTTAVSQADAPSLKLRPGQAADSQAVPVTIELRLGDFVTIKPALALNLETVQKQMHARFDGILSEDILREFSTVRIDYKNQVVELEK